jgi:hypothetical protein
MNIVQRRKNKNAAQRRDQRKIKTNKYVKISLIYYNEKEKQFGRMILGQNLAKITLLQ